MIKLENVVLASPEQMEFIIEGMRNPMNSWEKSDSERCEDKSTCDGCSMHDYCDHRYVPKSSLILGSNDLSLMQRLANAGTDHRKFMRMMPVYVRITAPLYWWKEFDTYKAGTVANSCSTMHKIQEKEFTLEDFSTEHLSQQSLDALEDVLITLNRCRVWYISKDDKRVGIHTEMSDECYAKYKKDLWWQMIQLLPSSYNQTRNVMMNYEVLANIYKSRKNHKLDEWKVHETQEEHKFRNKDFSSGKWGFCGFCDWIESLPYSELITGGDV